MPRAMSGIFGDERGTMAVEYGILAAFIAVAVIVLVTDVGAGVLDILQMIAGYFPAFSG